MMYDHEKSDPANKTLTLLMCQCSPFWPFPPPSPSPQLGNRLRSWWSQGRGPRGMCVSKARAGHSTG